MEPMIFWDPIQKDQGLCVDYITFMYAQYALNPMGLRVVEPTPRRVTGAGQCLTGTKERRSNGCEKGGRDNAVLKWGVGPSKKGVFLPGEVFFSLIYPVKFQRLAKRISLGLAL
jgi:hypothetical protein